MLLLPRWSSRCPLYTPKKSSVRIVEFVARSQCVLEHCVVRYKTGTVVPTPNLKHDRITRAIKYQYGPTVLGYCRFVPVYEI
jgi:hypothetical protein